MIWLTWRQVRTQTLLTAALLTVLAGWPLSREVGKLRLAMYNSAGAADAEARELFVQAHLASLLLNVLTVILVTAAMCLAAWLPDREPRVSSEPEA